MTLGFSNGKSRTPCKIDPQTGFKYGVSKNGNQRKIHFQVEYIKLKKWGQEKVVPSPSAYSLKNQVEWIRKRI